MSKREPETLEETLEALADRIRRLGELLADVTADIRDLARLFATSSQRRTEDALLALLDVHQAEIARSLASDRSAPPLAAAAESSEHAFPFRLDPVAREVRIGRRKVSLTLREFQVLEVLWEQMPSVVSREAILERVYGADRGRSERVVDVYIYNLRQKLRMAGATDAAIQSRKGAGWRLHLDMPAEWDGLLP